MRIAIVGTSNSILTNGYTYALAQSKKFTHIQNFSMGGSISLLASVTTKGIDFSQFDAAILDFAVNEILYLRRGITPEDMYEYERALVGRLLSEGCLPIILIMPAREIAETVKVRDHHLRLARDLNLPYFDGISHLEKFTAARGLDREMLFHDGAHLTRWFAIALGHQLAEALETVLRDSVELIDDPWACNRYRAVGIGNLVARAAHIPRKNSRFSMSFARLNVGDKLQVSVPPGSAVRGVWANFASSAGIMKLTGESELLIDMRSPYHQPDRPLQNGFSVHTLALAKPVPAKNDTLGIEIVPLQEIPEEERRNLYRIQPCQRNHPDLGSIELGGLIIQGDRAKEVKVRPAPRFHVDLSTIIKSAALETAVDIFLSHGVSFPKPKPPEDQT